MFETEAELAQLQRLLDASLRGSTSHLRSIIRVGERTLSAGQLVQVLEGMRTVAMSTVTAKGEPRITGADGHFVLGRWIVGTDREAAKARHLAARPGVSVARIEGEALGVFVHGQAVPLNEVGAAEDQQWPHVLEYLRGHYGPTALRWERLNFYRVEPCWMVAYSNDPKRLLTTQSA